MILVQSFLFVVFHPSTILNNYVVTFLRFDEDTIADIPSTLLQSCVDGFIEKTKCSKKCLVVSSLKVQLLVAVFQRG